MDAPTKPTCRHCTRNRATRPRRLCSTCYRCPDVLVAYPPGSADPAAARHLSRATPEPRFCWACDAEAPPVADIRGCGWATRRTTVKRGDQSVVERYCPGCFARWGWPPETVLESEAGDPLRPRPERQRQRPAFLYGLLSPADTAELERRQRKRAVILGCVA